MESKEYWQLKARAAYYELMAVQKRVQELQAEFKEAQNKLKELEEDGNRSDNNGE